MTRKKEEMESDRPMDTAESTQESDRVFSLKIEGAQLSNAQEMAISMLSANLGLPKNEKAAFGGPIFSNPI